MTESLDMTYTQDMGVNKSMVSDMMGGTMGTDFCFTIHKPRNFKGNAPIMEELQVDNYDKVDHLSKLVINLEEAMIKFTKNWRTLDK